MTKSLCIISGSTLGGAEDLAEEIASQLAKQGIENDIFHGPTLQDVAEYSHWLVVTSTHGAGELPDNLQPLFMEIYDHNPTLPELKFAVIGLGNSDYDTFCYAVERVRHTLSNHLAKELCPALKIDMKEMEDPILPAENWLPSFTKALKA